MQLYMLSLLSFLVLILLIGLFYLYKQYSLLLVKVNQLTYNIETLQKNNNDDGKSDDNLFGNMDLMSNFMNTINQNSETNDDTEVDVEEDDDDEDDDDEDDDEEDDDDEDIADEEDINNADEEDINNADDLEEVLNDEKVNDEKVNDEKVNLVNDIKFITLKSKKKVPNNLAKEFDVGYTEESSNDNCKYAVIADKNGLKRWKKMK